MQLRGQSHHNSLLQIAFVLLAFLGLLVVGLMPARGAPLQQTTTRTYLPLVTKNHDPAWQWQPPSQLPYWVYLCSSVCYCPQQG